MKHYKTIVYSFFLLCICGASEIISMQQDRLSLEEVKPLFFKVISTKEFDLCKAYVEVYPELLSCQYVDTSSGKKSNLVEYAYNQSSYDSMRYFVEKGCCTNIACDGTSMLIKALDYTGVSAYLKMLISLGQVCNQFCKHSAQKPHADQASQDVYDKAFEHGCSVVNPWNTNMYFLLATSANKKTLLERYNKGLEVPKKYSTIPFLDESFLHFLALGNSMPCKPELLPSVCVFPCVSEYVEEFLAQCTTCHIKKYFSYDVFEYALVVRNKQALTAFLKRVDLIGPYQDEATQHVLETLESALQGHQRYCPAFAEEIICVIS